MNWLVESLESIAKFAIFGQFVSSMVKTNPWFAPLAWLYKMAISFRHRLFDWGILPTERFDIPIVCIGNITVGGTGKTPMVAYIVQLLVANGHLFVFRVDFKNFEFVFFAEFQNVRTLFTTRPGQI